MFRYLFSVLLFFIMLAVFPNCHANISDEISDNEAFVLNVARMNTLLNAQLRGYLEVKDYTDEKEVVVSLYLQIVFLMTVFLILFCITPQML